MAVGAIYSTTTMGKSGRTALGPDVIRQVKQAVSAPVVAIGGVNADNIAEVARAGADCICVVSAVTYADDPERATAELVKIIESARARLSNLIYEGYITCQKYRRHTPVASSNFVPSRTPRAKRSPIPIGHESALCASPAK